MTKNQIANYFTPSAPWATNPAVIPQTAASAKAINTVALILRRAAIELPGISQAGAPPVPDVIYGLEDILQRVYNSPSIYKLLVPVNVRRLCAAIVNGPCGPQLAQVVSNPQSVA